MFHSIHPRLRCDTTFLTDDSSVDSIASRLSSLQQDPIQNWQQAHHIFRQQSQAYKAEHKTVEAAQLLPHLLSSTSSYVPPQAWKVLAARNICPDTHAQAYLALVALHKADESEKVGTMLLENLKGVLAGEALSNTSQKDRSSQINKLMRQLQACNRLGWVQSNTGQVLTEPVAIASALEEHWTSVTAPGFATVSDCHKFLSKLPLPPNFSIMARALFRPLSSSLRTEALDRVHASSSPDEDGIGAELYKTFRSFFEPLMLQICNMSFNSGMLPDGWEPRLIDMIPKAAGLAAVSKLRPIALQNVEKKWMMTIVTLQIEQIIQQSSHKQQVGCIKGRQMINHICNVKGDFESLNQGPLINFDFSNAFCMLSHSFIEAVLQMIQLPPFHIRFFMATPVAPYFFCVGKGIAYEVMFTPRSGIGQGDPFSPLLFSFCASFVLFSFNSFFALNGAFCGWPGRTVSIDWTQSFHTCMWMIYV